MSHFTVLVVAKDEEELQEKLIPYYELGTSIENDVAAEKYRSFKSMDDEYRKEYEKENIDMIRIRINGFLKVVFSWDRDLPTKLKEGSKIVRETNIPDDAVKLEMPFKVLYPTFDDFCSEYHGAEKNEETGEYGYVHNPNAKWDWYSIGGRWADAYLDKYGLPGVKGLIKHWDWETKTEDGDLPYTFAFINDIGEWIQRAEMGWWAFTSDENADYHKQFEQFVKDEADKHAYLIDCHI